MCALLPEGARHDCVANVPASMRRQGVVMLLAVARALRPVARSIRPELRPKSTVAEAENKQIQMHPQDPKSQKYKDSAHSVIP